MDVVDVPLSSTTSTLMSTSHSPKSQRMDPMLRTRVDAVKKYIQGVEMQMNEMKSQSSSETSERRVKNVYSCDPVVHCWQPGRMSVEQLVRTQPPEVVKRELLKRGRGMNARSASGKSANSGSASASVDDEAEFLEELECIIRHIEHRDRIFYWRWFSRDVSSFLPVLAGAAAGGYMAKQALKSMRESSSCDKDSCEVSCKERVGSRTSPSSVSTSGGNSSSIEFIGGDFPWHLELPMAPR
ncbi:unnamed protein product [Amoebophrya sp. A25]|nr:unnamed protein product [Amoebophrya sp. A25]|eukprot:GSA25T00014560001.1